MPRGKPSVSEKLWVDSLSSAFEAEFEDSWHDLGHDRYACLVSRGDSSLGSDAFGRIAERAEATVRMRKTISELHRRDSLMTGDHPHPIALKPWCQRIDSMWYATMDQRARSR